MKLISKYKQARGTVFMVYGKYIALDSMSIDTETYDVVNSPLSYRNRYINNYNNAYMANPSVYGMRNYYDADTQIWNGGRAEYNDGNILGSGYFEIDIDMYSKMKYTLSNGDIIVQSAYNCALMRLTPTYELKYVSSLGLDYHNLHILDVDEENDEIYLFIYRAEKDRNESIMKIQLSTFNIISSSSMPSGEKYSYRILHVDKVNKYFYISALNQKSYRITINRFDSNLSHKYLNVDDSDDWKYMSEIQGHDDFPTDSFTIYQYHSIHWSQWQEFDENNLKGWRYACYIRSNSDNTKSYPMIFKYNFDLTDSDDVAPDSIEYVNIDWGDFEYEYELFPNSANTQYIMQYFRCFTFYKENGEKILTFIRASQDPDYVGHVMSFTIDPNDPLHLTYNQDVKTFYVDDTTSQPGIFITNENFKELVTCNRGCYLYFDFWRWTDDNGWQLYDTVTSRSSLIIDNKNKKVITCDSQYTNGGYNVYDFGRSEITLTGLKESYTYNNVDINETLKLNAFYKDMRISTDVVVKVLTDNAKIMAVDIVYEPYTNETLTYDQIDVGNDTDLDRFIYDFNGTYTSDVTYDMIINKDVPKPTVNSDFEQLDVYTNDEDGYIDTGITPDNIETIEFQLQAFDDTVHMLLGSADDDNNFTLGRNDDGTFGIGLGSEDGTVNTFNFETDSANWADPDWTNIKITWDGDLFTVYQDDTELSSKSLTDTGGALPTDTVYILNRHNGTEVATYDAACTIQNLYVNKTVTDETDGVNDPMSVIFESTDINTKWGNIRTTADADNSYNTSSFKVYSSLDGTDWKLEYTNTHEIDGDYTHPVGFTAKYAKIDFEENNSDGYMRLIVPKDGEMWWDITLPTDATAPTETNIGQFTTSSVTDTPVELIISDSGSVEIETYAMTLEQYNIVYGTDDTTTE